MTRLAVLSDVHGNLPALETVLSDVEAQGAPDATWVLGDLVAFCPWPVETLARLREIPGVAFLQGNTDRYLVTGRRPVFLVRSPDDWAAMPTWLAERDANFRWTVERLSYADCEFLRDLPPRLEMDVPGYGRIVAVHANLADDETSLLPDAPDDELRSHLAGLDARMLLYGHIHRPVDRVVDSVRLVNDGSVGLPLDGAARAAYALLDFADGECSVTIRHVAFDRDAVIAELERVTHPGRRWASRILRDART
jgi:predicted phosphodiesterase